MGKVSLQGVLGTLSPAYGMASGHGLFGDLSTSLFGNKQPGQPQAVPGQQQQPDPSMPPLPAPPPNSSSAYLEGLFRDLGIK